MSRKTVLFGIAATVVALTICVSSMVVSNHVTAGIIESGQSEDGLVEWELDENGKLTVRGTGTVPGGMLDDTSVVYSLVIEEGVSGIASSAFYGYSNLVSVELPTTLASIGTNAFSGCTSLLNLEIPEGVTMMGTAAFKGCWSLTSVSIPSTVTWIRPYTFQGCTSLTSVTLAEGLDQIGNSAFGQCYGLSGNIVTIPLSVTWMDANAFVKVTPVYGILMSVDYSSGGETYTATLRFDTEVASEIDLPSIIDGNAVSKWSYNEIDYDPGSEGVAIELTNRALEAIIVSHLVSASSEVLYAVSEGVYAQQIAIETDSEYSDIDCEVKSCSGGMATVSPTGLVTYEAPEATETTPYGITVLVSVSWDDGTASSTDVSFDAVVDPVLIITNTPDFGHLEEIE